MTVLAGVRQLKVITILLIEPGSNENEGLDFSLDYSLKHVKVGRALDWGLKDC